MINLMQIKFYSLQFYSLESNVKFHLCNIIDIYNWAISFCYHISYVVELSLCLWVGVCALRGIFPVLF